MDDSEIFIVGANGQLGLALQQRYPNAKSADVEVLDIADEASVSAFDWTGIKAILNAAAFTNVDGAEMSDGRIAAWKVNATAVANLVRVSMAHDITLVHISTDYVFDGTNSPHSETEPLSPLSVYGQSKAAGDTVLSVAPKHYLLRTTWVIGDGKNFVKTMLELGRKGVSPTVVADQVGRLTFTKELVRIVDHLLTTEAPYGTYNATNGGEPASWAQITRNIFALAGYDLTVTDTTTEAYYATKSNIAPRPLKSEMDLSKLIATGFEPTNWQDDLKNYVSQEGDK